MIEELLITPDDITIIILIILVITSIATIIGWILNFIPSFIGSILKKIQNKSIIYDTNYLDTNTLNYKTLVDKDEKNERK